MNRRRAGLLVTALLLAAGVAARLFGAWCYRYGENPDYGIVALMAKHMAEGSHFPVFFYGQAYMGSLEPAVSALICRVAGFSGLAVCLGTALIGILLLPVVYGWARDAGGRVAGMAALAYAVLGPEGYFHYQCSPRGGYAVTLLLGSLIIWLACRMAAREADTPAPPGRLALSVLLLGFLAGLGFWSHMLILPALLTTTLVLLAGLRRRSFSLPVLVGVPGFLLGSLPFWLWNARHGWRSFQMTSSFGEGGPGMERGMKLFWGPRLLGLLDLQDASIAWRVVVVGVHLGLAAVAVMAAVRLVSLAHRRLGRAGLALGVLCPAAAVVFILLSSLLFSLSTFAIYNSPRYLLPLLPAFAVLVGVGTAFLWERMPKAVACLPLLFLIGWQTRTLPNHGKREVRYAAQRADAIELGAFLEQQGIRHICTPYILHGLNYMLEERFVFADIQRERCAPLAELMEGAEHVAVMNGCGGISEFLEATGGSAQYTRFGQLRLHYDLVAPDRGLAEIPAERWESATTSSGEQVLEVLHDANLDTSVAVAGVLGQPDWLQVSLEQPESVAGVRLLSREAVYPALWEVQGQRTPEGPWETLKGPMKTTHFFWSGPRVYWNGQHLRMDCRFEPTTVQAIRLRMQAHPSHGRVALSELQVFTAGGTAQPVANDFRDLANQLKTRRITRLYADRWEANRVHQMTSGKVWTSREPGIAADLEAAARGPEWVSFDPHTALLAAESAVLRTRVCLEQRGILRMRETQIGPWTLFDFEPGTWREVYRNTPGILFRGFSCELGYGKYWAAECMQQAERLFAADGDASADGIAWLEAAVAASPGYGPAIMKLAEHLAFAGREEQAAEWRMAVRALEPEIAAEVRFEKGIHFHGLSVDRHEVRRGETFNIRYFWSCPPKVSTGTIAVFVHFEGSDGRFQDDHELLAHNDTRVQPIAEVFVEERVVVVPADAAAGEYEIRLGLYDRRFPRDRLQLHTRLPNRRRAAHLPITLRVLP